MTLTFMLNLRTSLRQMGRPTQNANARSSDPRIAMNLKETTAGQDHILIRGNTVHARTRHAEIPLAVNSDSRGDSITISQNNAERVAE